VELVAAIRSIVPERDAADAVPRVFQALRIQVNDEFVALDTILRELPNCLNSGGRAVIITFHSGEDRRVKQAFAFGRKEGILRGRLPCPVASDA